MIFGAQDGRPTPRPSVGRPFLAANFHLIRVLTFAFFHPKDVVVDLTPSHPLSPLLEEIPYHPSRSFVHQVESDQWNELGLKKKDQLLLEFRPLKDLDLALILHHGQSLLTRYRQHPKPHFLPPSPSPSIPESEAVLQGVVTCLVRMM